MEKRNGKNFTFPFSLVQATYWMSACAITAYAVIYLQALSFSNFSIGIITAAGRIIGAVFGPLIATYLDGHPKTPTSGMISPMLIFQGALLCLLLFFGKNDVPTGIIYAVLYGTFVSTNSVVLRFCGDCAVGGYRLNYGIARGIGSLAYIIPSVLLGIIFKQIPATCLPYAGIILLALELIVNVYAGMFFKGQRSISIKEAETGDSFIRFIKNEPVFTRLLAGLIFLFFGYCIYATFLINIVKNAGGDTASMGLLSGFGAAIEIPAMFLLSRLRKRWRISTLLKVSLVAFSVKALALAMATDIAALFAVQLLQAFSYALYAAAIVEYVVAVIPAKNQAKGQSLIYTTELISGIMAGLIAGRLLDVTTVKTTLIIGFIVTAVGTVISLTGVKKAD